MGKGKIIIISLILVFIVVVFLLVSYQKKKDSYYLYLFTGDLQEVKWYYNKDNWYLVNTNKQLDEMFNTYLNGKYQGKYNLVFNNNWYYFDEYNKSVKINGMTFMTNTNYDFESYEFEKVDIDDNQIVTKMKDLLDVDDKNYNIKLTKYNVMSNPDIEEIYSIYFIENNIEYNVSGPSYSAIFTYDKNKVKIIKSNKAIDSTINSCYFDLTGVMRFDNKKTKILLSCIHFDQIPSDYYLYEKSSNSYKLIVDSIGG